jgi:hypothetical protein
MPGLDDALLYVAITRLHDTYADITTRRAWDELASITTTDARFSYDMHAGDPIELVGGAALADFGRQVTERFSFYQYIPLNTAVEATGEGTARGRFYSLEIARDRSSEELTHFYGLYHDHYVCCDDRWVFASRDYQTLARQRGDQLDSFPPTLR